MAKSSPNARQITLCRECEDDFSRFEKRWLGCYSRSYWGRPKSLGRKGLAGRPAYVFGSGSRPGRRASPGGRASIACSKERGTSRLRIFGHRESLVRHPDPLTCRAGFVQVEFDHSVVNHPDVLLFPPAARAPDYQFSFFHQASPKTRKRSVLSPLAPPLAGCNSGNDEIGRRAIVQSWTGVLQQSAIGGVPPARRAIFWKFERAPELKRDLAAETCEEAKANDHERT